MRILFITLILMTKAYAGTTCDQIDYESENAKISDYTRSKEAISINGTLFPDAKILCTIGVDLKNPSQYILQRVEVGTINGSKYRIYYTDGSGEIQGKNTSTLDSLKDEIDSNWSVACKIDEINDQHYCSISRGGLSLGIMNNKTFYALIGHENYPQSSISIRIDKNKPLSANESSGFSKKQTKEIIQQLQSGNSFITRYEQWPYEADIDTKSDLYKFSNVWAILNKVSNSIR